MAFLYETHMHTAEVSGCATATGAEQVRAYKKRGYAGIIITDHFINGYTICPGYLSWGDKMRFICQGYEAAKKEARHCGLDVFYGWEFTYRGSDFLTYGLDLDFLYKHPGLDKMPIETYSALVRENGGFLAQAHPFRSAPYIEHQLPVAPELIDAVEVYNATMDERTNNKALAFAKKHNLPRQAGSDSHHVRLKRTGGIMLQKKADTIQTIIKAIKAGEAGMIMM